MEALHRGEYEEAEAELQQAIAIAPRDARLRHELGLLYARWDGGDGHDSAAESCFARASELDPKHLSSLIQLGDLQLRRGLVEEAKRAFDRALRIDPNHRGARRGIDRAQAWVWRQRLPGLGATAGAVVLLLAGGLWTKSQPLPEITVRAPIVRSEPSFFAATAPMACPPSAFAAVTQPAAPTPTAAAPVAHTTAAPTASEPPAQIAKRDASPDTSDEKPATRSHSERRTARRARSTSRNGGAAELSKLVQKGDSALRSGRVDEALAEYQQALSKDPKFAPAHRGLGSVYVMQGRDSDAKAAYQKYLALAPHASDAPRIQALLQDM
jgi:tetratricopeptide (TPR) repeat protein